ncbi:uncharacterized protein LOC112269518 isoform X1 [Brachypodium distachyon]|uniref:uncharacterized protein LOC112269518 isoform X1 n=1 Tax=Brachypodium distachyon TaxID=15368 RepID=UPI000D0DCAF2|nr:uncharacterized protein LOC112269518 isoform X1 [Brachypodium distachyon]|eukprot:XP_024312143.1 uncharacterized protein LOC112269518 isoform X1 [Brachypodium distachyon]
MAFNNSSGSGGIGTGDHAQESNGEIHAGNTTGERWSLTTTSENSSVYFGEIIFLFAISIKGIGGNGIGESIGYRGRGYNPNFDHADEYPPSQEHVQIQQPQIVDGSKPEGMCGLLPKAS